MSTANQDSNTLFSFTPGTMQLKEFSLAKLTEEQSASCVVHTMVKGCGVLCTRYRTLVWKHSNNMNDWMCVLESRQQHSLSWGTWGICVVSNWEWVQCKTNLVFTPWSSDIISWIILRSESQQVRAGWREKSVTWDSETSEAACRVGEWIIDDIVSIERWISYTGRRTAMAPAHCSQWLIGRNKQLSSEQRFGRAAFISTDLPPNDHPALHNRANNNNNKFVNQLIIFPFETTTAGDH